MKQGTDSIMTIVDKKMNLDQSDILNSRLDQMAAVLNVLSAEDQHHVIGEDNTRTVLYAAEELLNQARAAWKDLFVESARSRDKIATN